jgi:hypothetical protein
MNIPTREEVERIDKKLLSVSSRLKKIEESRKTTGDSQA